MRGTIVSNGLEYTWSATTHFTIFGPEFRVLVTAPSGEATNSVATSCNELMHTVRVCVSLLEACR